MRNYIINIEDDVKMRLKCLDERKSKVDTTTFFPIHHGQAEERKEIEDYKPIQTENCGYRGITDYYDLYMLSRRDFL